MATLAGMAVFACAPPIEAQFASCSSGPAGSLCLSTGNIGIGTITPQNKLSVAGGSVFVSDLYAQTYPLTLQNSALKADSGNYIGLLMQTADSTSPLTGGLTLFTDPSGANRYLRIGAYESGSGWRNTVLNGHIGFGVTPVTLLSNTSAGQDDGGRGVAAPGLTWVQTSNGDTGYTAGFVNPQSYTGAGNTAHGVFVKIADTSNQSNILNLLSGADLSRLLVKGDGTVGIGTHSPCASSNAPIGCLLTVNGAVQAKEVVVNTGWSDYVFESGYHLQSLQDVAAYIKQNHHLPDIPSAEEVAEKGVGIGEMQSKLLAKIEELTLQLIATEKRVRELERREGVTAR